MGFKITALLSGAALLTLLIVFSSGAPPKQCTLAAYSTNLADRTPNQRFNARKAARLIDGAVITPGTTFSFNGQVGGWSEEQGYRKAPVSYNGVLVDEYGGGVCQTSSTLYNAALLAGFKIVERHSHTFSPSYVPAGLDAAVAYQNVDLRFRNPYPFSVVLHAEVHDELIVCAFTSANEPSDRVTVRTRILDIFPAPVAPVEPGAGYRRSRWHLEGRPGVRVAAYRQFYSASGQLIKSQLISDNTYRGISAARWAM